MQDLKHFLGYSFKANLLKNKIKWSTRKILVIKILWFLFTFLLSFSGVIFTDSAFFISIIGISAILIFSYPLLYVVKRLVSRLEMKVKKEINNFLMELDTSEDINKMKEIADNNKFNHEDFIYYVVNDAKKSNLEHDF